MKGPKIFLEKSAISAQTRRKHAENASTLIRWSLPEENVVKNRALFYHRDNDVQVTLVNGT